MLFDCDTLHFGNLVSVKLYSNGRHEQVGSSEANYIDCQVVVLRVFSSLVTVVHGCHQSVSDSDG